MKYFKTVNKNGEITRLDNCAISNGEEISKVEYQMLTVAIMVHLRGVSVSTISEESWWK